MRAFRKIIQIAPVLPLVLLFAGPVFPGRAVPPETAPLRVFSADPQALRAAKAALGAGHSSLAPAWRQLLKEANARLDEKPPSVMDKRQLPPSGDKHDFMSQAPYFWRDTNSPDGKYVRRDGERNPESNADSDAGRLSKVCTGVHALGLAYYFSGDEKYAAQAAKFVRVFFLDPATAMKPNLNFGQGIPGAVEGRPTGLIGARGLAELVDGIGLLAGSQSWTPADQQKLTAWAAGYFHWLTTSKIGRGEDAAENNHGTFYDVQAVSLALFIGDTNYARAKVLAAGTKRIALEIEPNGKMPRELVRTLSFNYSLFNVRAEMQLADLARCVGVDLWHYETADGRSLRKAVEFMAPYADSQRAWPYPQIHRANRADLGEVLQRAAVEYPDSGPVQDALRRVQMAGDSPARLYLRLAPE